MQNVCFDITIRLDKYLLVDSPSRLRWDCINLGVVLSIFNRHRQCFVVRNGVEAL